MNVSVPREVREGEHRVALVPPVVRRLVDQGLTVRVEGGAGESAHFSDEAYKDAGAKVITDTPSLWGEADLLVKVTPPTERTTAHEIDLLRKDGWLLGLLNPLGDPVSIARLADRGVTAIALEMLPRIGRSQSMDALSSQAGIAGYKAAVLAAASLSKFFPMLTTAAGTVRPAQVFVMGAGVAGLQAIATARRLGAVVEAFDIRPAAKGEVESLGASFVEVALEEETQDAGGYAREVSEAAKEREREVVANHVAAADVVITTALVPGRQAPLLITEPMVAAMRPGSVIVDLAAASGGNCALTRAGEEIVSGGVTILGPPNLPASMPTHASEMYAKNVYEMIQLLVQDGEFHLNFEDEILDAATITHEGKVRNLRIQEAIEIARAPKQAGKAP